jgi:hypothetical protein
MLDLDITESRQGQLVVLFYGGLLTGQPVSGRLGFLAFQLQNGLVLFQP